MRIELMRVTCRCLVAYTLMGSALVKPAYGREPCSYPSSPVRNAGGITRFLAFGDSGTGAPGQYRLASHMEMTRRISGFDTALMLGDNLYPQRDAIDPVTRFERPYTDLLKNGVKFFPVLGNHDLGRNRGRDQITYFKMPGRCYSILDWPTEFFMLNSNRTQLNYEQLIWLHDSLSSSSAPWKIVAAHHPIYSSGKSGSAWWLKIFVEPLLVEYGVDIVLSGHDHHYERIKPQRGVSYFVSGGGGGGTRPIKNPKAFSESALATPHFLIFELGRRKGWFQAVNICGRVIDRGVLHSKIG